MKELEFVFPNEEYKQQATEYVNEFVEYNSEVHGSGGLDSNLDNYSEWLIKLENEATGTNIEEGRVPASTYFVVRKEDNKMVGMINIRHELNDYLLREGGHIGYSVRPTERKKGYATEILHLGLKECDKIGLDRVLVTCDKDNIASAKTIQKNSGVLENEVEIKDNITQRYWINVNEALEKDIKEKKDNDEREL